MKTTSTVFISDNSPSSNYSVFGIGFSGLGGLGFGLVLTKLLGMMMPHFKWQGLSSESLVYLVWVPSGLNVS